MNSATVYIDYQDGRSPDVLTNVVQVTSFQDKNILLLITKDESGLTEHKVDKSEFRSFKVIPNHEQKPNIQNRNRCNVGGASPSRN